MESEIRGHNIELLSKKAIVFDLDKLVAALEKNCGRVNVISADDEKGSYHVAYLDHMVEFPEGTVPSQSVFFNVDRVPNRESYAGSFQHSWLWRDAAATVSQCNHTFSIAEMLSTALPYKERVNLLHGVTQAALSVVACDALHWRISQQFLQPQDYLQERATKPENLTLGTMNVRMFNVQSNPGEMLMDTIGLSALGLPDVQCHFLRLDPNQMARLLYNIGYYVFDNGDIIQDGETIQGVKETDRWRCQHEVSLVQPEREVLDINPGKPYAAGNRA